MVVKQVSDLCLREAGRGFLISLNASNRYSASYLDSLERTIAMAALFSEGRRWPPVRELTTSHLEEYLTYLQGRDRWFGTRETANPRTVSQGYIDAQHRRLNRFFNWLIERGHVESNPMRLIKRPRVEERTVPVVSEGEMRDLLTLLDPALARTSGPPVPAAAQQGRAVPTLGHPGPPQRDRDAGGRWRGLGRRHGSGNGQGAAGTVDAHRGRRPVGAVEIPSSQSGDPGRRPAPCGSRSMVR